MTSRRDNISIRGFGALTVAPALRLPGDYGPWGRWGIDQQESVAGLSGHSLLTAFPLLGGEGGSEATGRGQTSRRLTASLHCPSNTDSVQSCCCPSHTDRRSRGAERPQVSDQSALARREESRSGAAISGVRRGATVPRRTEPKRVSGALAQRTGFDRFCIYPGLNWLYCPVIVIAVHGFIQIAVEYTDGL